MSLSEQIFEALAAVGRERFFHTEPPSGAEVASCERFLDREYLSRAVLRAGTFGTGAPRDDQDMRAAASRLIRSYVSAITAPIQVALAAGVALDGAASRWSVVYKSDIPQSCFATRESAVTLCDERPTTWRVSGTRVRTVHELRERAIGTLLRDHLRPLFDGVLQLVHLSPSVLWCNLAEPLDLLYEDVVGRLDPVRQRPFAADHAALFEAEALAGVDGPNPLRGQLRWETISEPDFVRPLQVRNTCCAVFVLPDRPVRYCRNCPLVPTSELVTLVRGWRERVARPSASVLSRS